MNILILTMNIGGNAPGIVNKRLISELSHYHKIDVVTSSDTANVDFSKVNSVCVIPYISLPEKLVVFLSNLKIVYKQYYVDIRPKIMKFLVGVLGFNPIDYWWLFKIKRRIKETNGRYDLVFSLCSAHHYASIVAGRKLSSILGAKWAVYSVDAIPSPFEWESNVFYRRGCKRMVRRYLSETDAFFSANTQMLNYQVSILSPRKDCLLGVIYNPSPNTPINLPVAKSLIFLYTGNIYGVRKVKYLLMAFKRLLSKYPEAKLYFVGSIISDSEFLFLTEKERESIMIFPRTDNLNSYYEEACCLIDIDADIENDIFLSSKVINYIQVNRPIICETGLNSPSRYLFKGIPSIIQCGHCSDELYMAMKNIIENPVIDFTDRKHVIDLFKVDNVVQKINKELIPLVSTRVE